MSPSNVLWAVMACATLGAVVGLYSGRNFPAQSFAGIVILVNLVVVVGIGALLWRSAA